MKDKERKIQEVVGSLKEYNVSLDVIIPVTVNVDQKVKAASKEDAIKIMKRRISRNKDQIVAKILEDDAGSCMAQLRDDFEYVSTLEDAFADVIEITVVERFYD